MRRPVQAVLLCTAALISACAPPAVYGRGDSGAQIPFVWTAVVGTLPLAQTTEATAGEQYVTLPDCPRAAVQFQEIRRYGETEVRRACAAATEQANRTAQGVNLVGLVAILPGLWFLYALINGLVNSFSGGSR
ncbi:hypothetical protein ACFFLM_01540 [Deinococcus oregonensis]|uniref:Lipoprotein n=1 Tax=Deinococcus oregonensis TaxID=1805970 RepID=A0ABV6AT43_9DEIO